MKLIFYDTNMISLVSTVTPGNSKAVIEHEIILVRKETIWLNFSVIENSSITHHHILGLPY